MEPVGNNVTLLNNQNVAKKHYSFILKDTAGPTGTGKDPSSLISRPFSVKMSLAKKEKRNGDSYVILTGKNVRILDMKTVEDFLVH